MSEQHAHHSIEPKYNIDLETGRIINRVSGDEIPTDEPVMIFRAQDLNVPYMLCRYLMLCQDNEHRLAIATRLVTILEWQVANPLRVKQPDTQVDELIRSQVSAQG